MSCNDIPSISDLEKTKLRVDHFGEIIDGTPSGTSINPVTGKVLTDLPTTLKNVGFKPASFTFVTGGTLTDSDYDRAVYNPVPTGDDNWYAWGGTTPKTIPPGSTPQTTGGFGENAWLLKTDNVLRPTSREGIRRSYASAGLILVDGSFEFGGTLNGISDVLLHESSGKAYSWAGPFPKIIPPDSSVVGFIDQSGKLSPTSKTLSRTELNAQTDAFFNKLFPDVKTVAHRGFSSIAMENTIWAFQKAKNLGADMLECDIQVTSDGIPVIFHDDTTARLMSGNVDVITSPYSTLAAMTFTGLAGTPYKRESIPRLVDVCDWLLRNDAIFLAEFKRLRSPADVELIINIVKQYGVSDKFVWQCNDIALLKEARKFMPNSKVAYFSNLFEQTSLDELSAMGNSIYMVQYAALNNDSTIGGNCRARGVELATWTSNNSLTLKNLRRQGLKYIITDVNLGRLH